MLLAKEFTIGNICSHKDWFEINRQYQRESDVWTPEDKKHLIDTILKDLDIPKLYLRQISDKKYEIVDGQQRIQTIWGFKSDKLALDGKISGEELDGKKYKDLPSNLVERFDNFQLTCILLMGYDDDKTRLLFSKLQRGKPLNPAEKLNAFPGSIVPVMRSIGRHSFFKKVVFSLKRYKAYHLATKLLLLEDERITDISPYYLYEFFEKNRNLKPTSSLSSNIKKVLNFLNRAFPDETPELNNDTWVINCYLLASYLIRNYVMDGKEKAFHDYYTSFWDKAEKAKWEGKGPAKLMKFVDANSSGTTSKKNIETRLNLMKQAFLEKNPNFEFSDPRRYFDHFEKTIIFRRDKGVCQECRKKVKWEDFEADHIRAHAKGGKTTLENGQVLCSACNAKKGAN